MKVIKATQQMLETRTLVLGFQGENLRTQLRIDCSATFAEYQNATPALAIKPPSGATYPVFVERDGNEVVWDIVANNLALKGDGELQLTFYKDNVIAKTSVGHITVNRSLQIDGEMPDVVATWIENANRKLAEVDAQIVELEGMVDTATDAATRAEQSASTASTKAEQAAGSAATATAKATEATNATGTATAKASEADQSAQTATEKATAAAESERIATTKAGEATTAAGTATTKAEQAIEAAQTATEKAEDASASATAAHASEINAAESADGAFSAEVGANAAKRAAETSATQAGISEQNAGIAAQTATQKAAEATQSATNAAIFAGTATTKAEEAAESAQAASDAQTAVEQTAEQLADSLEQIDQNTQDIAELEERKANIDGYYPDMTVGNAEQLNSSKYVENSEPYTFRTSGGTADIGNREYVDAVVGGTLAWNQMIKNGDFADGVAEWMTYNCATTASNGIATVTPTNRLSRIYQAKDVILNHKYLMSAEFKGTSGEGSAMLSWYGGVNQFVPFIGSWQNVSILFSNTFQTASNWQLHYGASQNANNVAYQIRNAVCFDLTQMFGTTVADYIYNLETANAGAGVALFRSWFPNDYYEYNPGELRHVEGLQSHDMVGFNAWDEEWEVGRYNPQTGEKETQNTTIRSTNYIPVFPNTSYYVRFPDTIVIGNVNFCYYDADKNFISFASNQNNPKTTPANASYMTLYIDSNYGTTYKHDICISLAHNNSRNGEYEPYEKHSYPLDSSVILRGIPKVGTNGVYWDGDRYLPDGTVERRYGVLVIDGVNVRVNTWEGHARADGYIACYRTFSEIDTNINRGTRCVSDRFSQSNLGYSAMPPYSMDGGSGAQTSVSFIVPGNNVSEANAWFAEHPTTVVYELATPTIEQAQPYHSTQWVSDWGTEEFVSTGIVPVGTETRYPANLRDKLQHLPDAASGNGSYLISQTDGQMVLTPFPAPPSTAGNYVLKATVTGGVATYTWEVAT